MLDRLARGAFRHRRLVLLAWIVVLVATSVLNSAAGGKPSMKFKLPKSEAQTAQDLLTAKSPELSGGRGRVVFEAPGGIDTPVAKAVGTKFLDELKRLGKVKSISSPWDANPAALFQVSKDRKVAFADVLYTVTETELGHAYGEKARPLAARISTPDVHIELSGVMFQQQKPPGATELIGIVAAIVILLVSFGSVLAMGLPIITALFGIGIGLAGVGLLSNVMSMPEFAGQLAAMIGIGVGIDYALFIVTRYRTALHDGASIEDAVAKAIGTSGKAVLFAGCTVVISLLGMFLMGIEFVRGLATGASLAVLVTMIASVTLLPALLGFVGTNVDKWALPWARKTTTTERNVFFRFSRVIQRRPWTMAAVGLVILGALAVPMFSIRLGNSDASNLPASDTTRKAYDLLADAFGKGFNGPLFVAVELTRPGDADKVAALAAAATKTPGVQAAFALPTKPGDTVALMQVVPTTSPQDRATVQLIDRLRTKVFPAAVEGSGLKPHIGGVTAAFDELADLLAERLPLFIAAVLALSFLLLLVVFRSVFVPLKAVVMNLLSIAASYGLLVAVFQWGWGASIIGVGKSGPIESFVPMMMFAIIFGLSMDYEVFLLSRVKEEYDRHGDNGRAVADGLAHTARVITAAAAIMVCVFGSFVFGDNRVVKMFGLGLAAAVFIDATVVRMVLVPATMELLGKANWWFPAWLDRIVPRIHIEGESDAWADNGTDGDDADPDDERELVAAGH